MPMPCCGPPSPATGWHTLLGKPEVKPLKINVPLGYGYILTSKKAGGSFAVVDVHFMQKEIFKQLPKQEGKLVVAVTHNVTYYTDGTPRSAARGERTESMPPPATLSCSGPISAARRGGGATCSR